MKKNDIIFGRLLPAIMLTAVLVTGCGSSAREFASEASEAVYDAADNMAEFGASSASSAKSAGGYSYDGDFYADEEAVAEEAADIGVDEDGISTVASGSETPVLNAKKIVYHADVSLSSKEFDTARAQIEETAEKYGAILQSENFNQSDIGWYMRGEETGSEKRYYYVEYRVPADNYRDMLNETYNMNAVVNNMNRSAQNITQRYSDVSAEIESLETELEQLEEIMKDAKKIEDVLYIQERITEVRTSLNQAKSDIRMMDTDVAYSYVNISLQEVKEYKEPEPPADLPFEQQLMLSFNNSIVEFYKFCDDAAIFAARNWIKIIVFIIILIILIAIIRGGGARRYARRELKREYKEKKLEMKRKYREMKQEKKEEKKQAKEDE